MNYGVNPRTREIDKREGELVKRNSLFVLRDPLTDLIFLPVLLEDDVLFDFSDYATTTRGLRKGRKSIDLLGSPEKEETDFIRPRDCVPKKEVHHNIPVTIHKVFYFLSFFSIKDFYRVVSFLSS